MLWRIGGSDFCSNESNAADVSMEEGEIESIDVTTVHVRFCSKYSQKGEGEMQQLEDVPVPEKQ